MALFAHIVSTEHSGSNAFGDAKDYLKELISQAEQSGEEDLVMIVADELSMVSLVPFYDACLKNKDGKVKPVFGLKAMIQSDVALDFLLEEGNFFVDSKNRLIVEEADNYKVILEDCTVSFDEENNVSLVKQGKKLIVDETNKLTEIGLELTQKFTPDYIKKPVFDKDHEIIVVAKDEVGRRAINRIVTATYQIETYSKYRKVTWDQLKKDSEGLMMISGGKEGSIEKAVVEGNMDLAKKRLSLFEEVFAKDDIYLQVQRVDNTVSGQEREEKIIEGFKVLEKEVGAQLFVCNDVRFPKKSNYKDFIIRKKAMEKNALYHPADIINISEEQYLKSTAEMIELFKEMPDALANTVKLTQKTDLSNYKDRLYQSYLPEFPIPEEFDNLEGIDPKILEIEDEEKKTKEIVDFKSSKFLRHLSYEGLEWRWPQICKNQNWFVGQKSSKGDDVTEEFLAERRKFYEDQIDMELEVIHRTGFPGYFLIVQDLVGWCKDNDIPVGPGRGSGAGSMVLYCLKITDIDSIEYDLLFERFLNPERVGEPDIDIDFSPRQRQKVIKYMASKYGSENTAQILTYGTMAAKDVVDNIGRVIGMLPDERNRIKDIISGDPGTKLKNELDEETGNEKLIALRNKSSQVDILMKSALELEGATKSYGKHAGGVVISYGAMDIYAGLYQEAKDQGVTEDKELLSRLEEKGVEKVVPVVQVDKNLCETVGLIKFDILGLKNLDIIDDCIKFLQKNNPELANFRPEDISPHDEKAIELFRHANTYGIFQFESPAMRRLMKQMVPDNFDEVIALVALFRPGPLQSGMAADFVDRKHGREPVVYPHRDLSELLKATYGTIIYQEQVMQISRVLSGFTRGEADTLRKAMGKKQFDLMQKMRKLFTEGAGHKYCQETLENTGKRFPSILDKSKKLSININLEDVEHPKIKEILKEEISEEHIEKLKGKFNFFGRFVSTKEQVLAFLKEFADLTEEEETDLEVRIDGMKDLEFFKEFKDRTLKVGIPKLVAEGMSEEDAELLLCRFFVGSGVFVRFNEIFSKMNEFAAYGFNASHSVAYATVSMQTAYLKAHYPAQYMAALISNDSNLEKAAETAREIRRMGINILRPDINESEANFYALSCNKSEKNIRYGLGMIRSAGNKAKNIIARREEFGRINDIYDFYQAFADYKTSEIVQKEGIVKEQNSKVVDKTVLNALLNSGALDSLCPRENSDFRPMLLATYKHINDTFADLGKRLKKNFNEIKKKINAKSVSMTHTDLINELSEETRSKLGVSIESSKDEFINNLEKELIPSDLTKYDLDMFFEIYNAADKLVSGTGLYHSTKEFVSAVELLSGIQLDSDFSNLSLNMMIEYTKSTFTKMEKAIKQLEKDIDKAKKAKKKSPTKGMEEKLANIQDSNEYKFTKFVNNLISGDVEVTMDSMENINAKSNIEACLKHKQMKYTPIFDLETELKTSHGGEEIEMKEYEVNGKKHYYVIPTSKEMDEVPRLNTKERATKEFNVTGMYQTTHPLMVDALRESLQADNFNPAPLGSILPLISQMGRPHSKIEGKHYMDGKIAGSILAMSDFRGFNEKTERMETKVTLVVDDGTGIVQAKFAAEDVFSAGREDKGVKMLFDMKEKNADVVLLEGSLTQGSYESEGAIMYVNKIGSANPDIYLPVDDAELNAVEEVSVAYISPKQLNFLKSLLKRKNVAEQDILDEYGVSKLEELELSIGSDLIGKYSSK
jgi:DNA-directed DNA polymerase III PolC